MTAEQRKALDRMIEIAEEAGMYQATATPLAYPCPRNPWCDLWRDHDGPCVDEDENDELEDLLRAAMWRADLAERRAALAAMPEPDDTELEAIENEAGE